MLNVFTWMAGQGAGWIRAEYIGNALFVNRCGQAKRSEESAPCGFLQAHAQIADILPLAALRRTIGFLLQFLIALDRLSLDEPVGQLCVGQDGAEEGDDIAPLHQQCGEVFNIDIAEQVGLVFDIDPDKTLVGVLGGKTVKTVPIAATGIAPGGAQAGNDPGVFIQPAGKAGILVVFEGKAVDGH